MRPPPPLRRRGGLLLAFALAAAPAMSGCAGGMSAAKSQIEAAEILRHIRVLASDEFEGRAPGSRGETLTVQYLVEQLRGLGLSPGNPDGTYVQEVPFIGAKARTQITIHVGDTAYRLEEPEDFWAGSLRQVPEVTITDSELVFAGHGITAPEYGWDDFKGADLAGRTLLTLASEPALPDPKDPSKLDEAMFAGRAVTRYAMSEYKREAALKVGAAARFTLFEPVFGARDWASSRMNVSGLEDFDLAAPDRGVNNLAASGELSPAVSRALFEACGLDLAALRKAALRRDFRPVPLGAKLTLRLRQELREVKSHNVVALLRGSDPKLRKEYVVYTAHWDHLGRDPALPGDQIFNGARDNASGVAALLAVAKAFRSLPAPPRRSILFLFPTGEERGLLGARYYLEHPLYPLESTVADLNIDIINTFGPTQDVAVVGYGRTTLSDQLAALAKAQRRVAVPFPAPELGSFYRSDHYAFARRGIPAIFMSIGRHALDPAARDDYPRRYHTVFDEVLPEWNLEGAALDYRLYFELGVLVANEEARPAWRPGDEFAAARRP